MAFRIDSVKVCVVGAGAAGTVLARALHHAGVPIHQVISRSLESARQLAGAVEAESASDSPLDLAAGADLVVLAVPDDQLAAVARELASVQRSWPGCIVMHLSGAVPSAVLAPVRDSGAEVMSFHPMLSLHRDSSTQAFAGAWVNVEGDSEAVEAGRQIAGRLHARAFVVDAETKAAIHLAASMASNFLVTLMAAAVEILEASGIAPEDCEGLLRPLVAGTLANIDFRDPGAALTGPISRSDRDTLEAHLDGLERLSAQFTSLFAVLAAETVRIALRSGKIDDFDAAGMLDRLQERLDRSSVDR